MTYGEVKNSILALGFENETTLEDEAYQTLFIEGINRALREINVEFPIKEKYPVTSLTDSDDYQTIDFSAFDDFDILLYAKIKREVGGRTQILPFADFDEDDSIIQYRPTKGEITFYYRTRITPVDSTTDDGTELTILYRAEPLLPLLASYYIWNDDDPEKAAKWLNEYEDMKASFKKDPQPKLTFVGGF